MTSEYCNRKRKFEQKDWNKKKIVDTTVWCCRSPVIVIVQKLKKKSNDFIEQSLAKMF